MKRMILIGLLLSAPALAWDQDDEGIEDAIRDQTRQLQMYQERRDLQDRTHDLMLQTEDAHRDMMRQSQERPFVYKSPYTKR
jgi:hypothetical protein